ncbi:MAG: HAMP domain-containing protein, partial [Rhodoglobus sp.]
MTLAATVIVLIVLAVTGAALVASQSLVLTDNVDEVLIRDGQTIEAQLDAIVSSGVVPGMGDDDAFGHVVAASGQVLASTTGPAGQFAVEDMGLQLPTGGGSRFQSVHVPGEPDYRVMIRPIGDVLIVVGTPLDDVQDSVNTLVRALVIATPAASLVLALFVWLLVGRVLRPVERIRTQVAAIGGESLDRRVPVPGSGDEIARLADTMNGMLDRIEGSAERQRRFVADASHELRGPLTRIRTELEVDLAHPEAADLAATHRSILDDTKGLENLVDDLLT